MTQDAAFYTSSSTWQTVWYERDNPFYVVRNGELRIHATAKDGSRAVIRYTDQLEDFGITTDTQLAEWSAKGEEVFEWVHNPWFEVYSENDLGFFSDPIHEIDEAIKQAKEFLRDYPSGTTEGE